MRKIIENLGYKVNQMYSDLGFQEKDIYELNADGTYSIFGNGAKKFREQFLIKDFFKENGEEQEQLKGLSSSSQLLTIINSVPSLEALREANKKAKEKFVSPKIGEILNEDNTLFTKMEKEILNKINDIIGPDTERTITTLLSDSTEGLFTSQKRGNKNYFRIKGQTNKKEREQNNDISMMLNQINKDFLHIDKDLDLTSSKEIKKFQKNLETIYQNRYLYRNIGSYYYNHYLKKYLTLIEQNETLPEDVFLSFFEEVCSNYTSLDFSSGESTSAKGFVLEFGLFISMKDNLNEKMITKILGQELEQRVFYQGTRKTTNGSLVANTDLRDNGVKVVTSQSASDFVIEIPERGIEYRLQLKNNLTSDSDVLSFRAQPEIKLNTFLLTAVKDNTMQDLITYLLVNTAYLRKYGLSRYNSKGVNSEQLLKTSDDKDLEYYIEFLIAQGYQYILGQEYLTKVNDMLSLQKGNIAFIFQGKYLIPVATFFVSAYNILIQLKERFNSQDKQFNNTIGGLSMPTFNEIKKDVLSSEKINMSNREYQENKINLLETGKYNDWLYGEYKYPMTLVEYGQSAGQKVADALSFRLRITLQLKAIENLL